MAVREPDAEEQYAPPLQARLDQPPPAIIFCHVTEIQNVIERRQAPAKPPDAPPAMR